MIKLNEFEKSIVMLLHERRRAYNEHVKTKPTPFGKSVLADINLDSIGAEVAFCKMMNLYPDFQYEEYKDDDALLHNGLTVDVKCTKYKSGKLLVKILDDRKYSDIFALMIGKFPNYRFAGFAYRDEIINENNVDTSMPQECFALPQSKLHKDLKV